MTKRTSKTKLKAKSAARKPAIKRVPTKARLKAMVGVEMAARLEQLMAKEKIDLGELLRRALVDYHNEYYVTKPQNFFPPDGTEVPIPTRPRTRPHGSVHGVD